MLFLITVKAAKESQTGLMRSEHLFRELVAYHEELQKAGLLFAASGLQADSNSWRIQYAGKTITVIDKPFAGTKGNIAAYALIRTQSREEALEWTKRFPNPAVDGKEGEIEVRQLFEF